MRFSFKFISSLFLVSLSSKVLANQCQELSKDYDIDLDFDFCRVNDDGLATKVSFYGQENIKKNTFKELTAVEELRMICHLSQTNIDEIATLTNLKELYISGVNFKDLDFSPLSKLKNNLKILYFYGEEDNYVTEFPKFVYSLSSLEELYLAGHKFKSSHTIPKDIGSLKSLKKFEMTDMEIVGGLDPLATMENIEEIYLNYCKIDDEIPESLNNLKKLKAFEVYETGIRGKALTNESLRRCGYGKTDKVCKTKDLRCLEGRDKIKNCEEVSDSTITTNGRCGNGNGRCPDGECCSKYGYCGKSEKHCYPSNGCQANLGDCFNYPVSTDGQCGPDHGRCPDGQCCSKYGYCGNSDKHCLISKSCQSDFGKCKEDPPTDARCGGEYGRCPRGQCCNKKGYCGITNNDCSVPRGCQTEFGECYGVNTSRCGDFIARCPEGQCCSKYNWCGRSDDHCGLGCKSEFGICK